MSSLLDISESRWGEWRFQLFDIPVRVQALFWLAIVLVGPHEDFLAVLMWCGVCLVSVLVHELGHAALFRAFGDRVEILLYLWGGLTRPLGARFRNTGQQVLIGLAGPVAGFLLAGIAAAGATALGGTVQVTTSGIIPSVFAAFPAPPRPDRLYAYKALFWNFLLFVNVAWGLMNLLPIYPLDGGRVARSLFEEYGGFAGYRRSLMLSGLTAAAMAVIGVLRRDMYMVITFGILAAASLQTREAAPTRRTHGRWGDR